MKTTYNAPQTELDPRGFQEGYDDSKAGKAPLSLMGSYFRGYRYQLNERVAA